MKQSYKCTCALDPAKRAMSARHRVTRKCYACPHEIHSDFLTFAEMNEQEFECPMAASLMKERP